MSLVVERDLMLGFKHYNQKIFEDSPIATNFHASVGSIFTTTRLIDINKHRVKKKKN